MLAKFYPIQHTTLATRTLMLSTLLYGMIACQPGDSNSEEPALQKTVTQQALDNPHRPQEDRSLDAGRMSAEIMSFCDITPGLTVLDFQAGTGYYAEILSLIVGDSGHVIAHNHVRNGLLGEEVFERRYGNNRLPNTELLFAKHNELRLSVNTLDRVLMSMVYHDTYYHSPDVDWGPVDQAGLLATLADALKPDATLCLIDHHAGAGIDPRESVHATHRIDIEIVMEDFRLAGFTLLKDSDLLRNPDDDYSLSVFDYKVHGKTDRFVLLFAPPKK